MDAYRLFQPYSIFTIMGRKKAQEHKPVHWVGARHDDLRKLPAAVAREIGFALGLRKLATNILRPNRSRDSKAPEYWRL
jgi:hypothetical protein